MGRSRYLALLLVACGGLSTAQDFPLWERLLSHDGGTTDATPVPSMKMGNHMQMSLKGRPQPGDEARAEQIVTTARDVLARYADVQAALRDGYKPFHPSGRMGEEVHYTNARFARAERQSVSYARPGSILYRRTSTGMQAVGVMYTAPKEATPAQLDRIAPLSIATWHRHVDFCGGPRSLPLGEQFGAHSAFGPQGSIHTEEACRSAQGLWIPVVFGWMTHLYPGDPQVWAGMDMEMGADTDALGVDHD